MNWLSSLFSPSSSHNSRKGQAIHSTHEAFSLPTHSPILSAHPDSAYNQPDTPNTSYTYPPPSPLSYAYSQAGADSRSSTLLPMHHDPLHTPVSPSTSSYPPLAETWNKLKLWLGREYPELGDTLNYGILPQDLADIELQFGFPLPAVVRESYLVVDGQEAESAAGCSEGLFFGLTLLPLEEVLDEWRLWREVDDDPSTGANPQLRQMMQSIPPNWIRREYSSRGWIPLIADKAGNFVGVDLNPGEGGAVGQVIVFGRDFDTKVVLYNGDGPAGWARWFAHFVDELENGDGWELGNNDASDEDEDDLGYESYFYDGTGRPQGDGGGDAAGGLRLTGEYKGWSVMEAWADRSVRKWYESGVITEKVEEIQDKEKETVDLNALDVNQAGAEVAIPVLSETSEVEQEPASPDVPRKTHQDLPTISVTKPPAPLPVELPTPHEIGGLPSPPDSTHSSFEEDIETGKALPERQTHHATGSTPIPPPPQRRDTPPDLLTESESLAEITPVIQPTSVLPSSTETSQVSEPRLIETESLEAVTEPNQEETPVDPDVTIRLVGGGGQSGVAEPVEEDETAGEIHEKDDDAESVTSAASESTNTIASGSGKKHKKTKSGLAKKLGQLGMRQKGSVGSTKEATAASEQ